VRDLLLILSQQEAVKPKDELYGSSIKALNDMLCARVYGKDPIFNRYTKGEIEEPLRAAILKAGVPEGRRDFEIHDNKGKIITVPDF
jgi:hypothetical protein